LANRIGVPLADVTLWLDQLATAMQAELQHLFTRKRDEIRNLLYREKLDGKHFPDTLKLLGTSIPLAADKRLGKRMIRAARGGLKARFDATPDITIASPFLTSARLAQILGG
jgi:hypothetical protein